MDGSAPPSDDKPNVTLALTGILLLLSAALKAVSDVAAGPVLPGVPAAWLHLVTLAFEVALGGWLVSGSSRPGAWLVGVTAFVLFSLVNVHGVWVGAASCGCFGELSVYPGWALLADLLVLTLLLTLGRPADWRRSAGPAVAFAGGFAATAGVVSLGAAWAGSTERALAAIRGDAALVEPAVLDMGVAGGEETLTRSVSVINRGAVPLRVVGGTSDCSCATVGAAAGGGAAGRVA